MIAFSYHKDCIGKPEKRLMPGDDKETLWLGNKKINLGYGWITGELSFEDIYELLSVGGYAFAPALNSDHRIEANFVSHALALVDIDGGMTLEELQAFPFYQLYGSGYYTTPSHTDLNPRFRILYRLPCAITDAMTMRVIYSGLLAVHSSSDRACKDAVRLFYGTVNAQHREITDRMIDAEGLQLLVQANDIVFERSQPKNVDLKHNMRAYEPKSADEVADLLDELRKYYHSLPYDTRRDVTWAVMSAVDGATAVGLLRSRWTDANSTMKYESFANDRKRNDLSLGTIYHMIRQHNPTYGKKPRNMSIDELRFEIERTKK